MSRRQPLMGQGRCDWYLRRCPTTPNGILAQLLAGEVVHRDGDRLALLAQSRPLLARRPAPYSWCRSRLQARPRDVHNSGPSGLPRSRRRADHRRLHAAPAGSPPAACDCHPAARAPLRTTKVVDVALYRRDPQALDGETTRSRAPCKIEGRVCLDSDTDSHT
jgi:hypothetical protein